MGDLPLGLLDDAEVVGPEKGDCFEQRVQGPGSPRDEPRQGGASVTRRSVTRQPGKRRVISRRPTGRTSGLAGFATWKSYQTTRPRDFSTRTASPATHRFNSESRMDVNTVNRATTSNVASENGSAAPLPLESPVPTAQSFLATATLSSSKSSPVTAAGSAPHFTNSRSQCPVPQPISRMRLSRSDATPCSARSCSTPRSRPCSRNMWARLDPA